MADDGGTIVTGKPGVVDFDEGRLTPPRRVNVVPKRVGRATPAQPD